MVYPGEQENVEYMNYVTQMAEEGQPALPKDQWRQTQQTPSNPAAQQSVIQAIMKMLGGRK